MDAAERRLDRVDRRLDGTTKLLHAGMKMKVDLQRGLKTAQQDTQDFKKETREAIDALIAAQMQTEATVKAMGTKVDQLVSALQRNSPNGRKH